MASAMTAVPNVVPGDGSFFLGVGVGNHDGESAIAVGLSGRVGADNNIYINAGASSSSGETSVRAGVGWVF